MKKTFKAVVVSVLAWQVKRLRSKHQFKIIAVVGSIGKTSTKLAIARILEESHRVRYQTGNYNDLVSVPLIFFNQTLPSLLNPFAWMMLFIKNEMQIHKAYPYDIVVVELGTDGPGQIAAFSRYIEADIAVVTALTPEHTEYFSGLSAVADEELSVAAFSKRLLVNIDLCPFELTEAYSGSFLSYSLKSDATYTMKDIAYSAKGSTFTIAQDRNNWLHASHSSFSEPQLYSLTAAAAVCGLLGVNTEAVVAGFARVVPVPGRMQLLKGINNTLLIDDTYNASPDATAAALKTLYRMPAPQKIALLGNMNELGTYSPTAHAEIGKLCDPQQLALVVTLGLDANKELAGMAEKNGCTVVRTKSPQEAGKVIAEQLQEGGIVLLKGSQNGVFAEEAVKVLLVDPADQSKLVRQSPSWLKIKNAQFKPQDQK